MTSIYFILWALAAVLSMESTPRRPGGGSHRIRASLLPPASPFSPRPTRPGCPPLTSTPGPWTEASARRGKGSRRTRRSEGVSSEKQGHRTLRRTTVTFTSPGVGQSVSLAGCQPPQGPSETAATGACLHLPVAVRPLHRGCCPVIWSTVNRRQFVTG